MAVALLSKSPQTTITQQQQRGQATAATFWVGKRRLPKKVRWALPNSAAV
jgi:hypothetical protein